MQIGNAGLQPRKQHKRHRQQQYVASPNPGLNNNNKNNMSFTTANANNLHNAIARHTSTRIVNNHQRRARCSKNRERHLHVSQQRWTIPKNSARRGHTHQWVNYAYHWWVPWSYRCMCARIMFKCKRSWHARGNAHVIHAGRGLMFVQTAWGNMGWRWDSSTVVPKSMFQRSGLKIAKTCDGLNL